MSERRVNGASSSSNRSSGNRDVVSSSKLHVVSSESIALECKAAFISVVKGASSDKSLTSKSELLLALQNTGRNPTHKSLSKHWTNTTEEIGFDEFCKICQKEPVTTADDLMKAFKKIDTNGDGYLSHSELKKVMTTKGEKMTDEEVTKLIDEVDENKDGKLDYNEFCNMVLNTSKQCKEKAIKRFEKKSPSRSSDSSYIGDRKGSINGALEEGNRHKDDSRNRRSSGLSSHEGSGSRGNVSREVGSMESGSRESANRRHREEEVGKTKIKDDRESKYSHRERKDSTGSIKALKSSAADGSESKRGVPMSPRMSPRVSPRVPKGTKNKEETQRDKYGSQTSLRSHDSKVNDDSPKPAPRQVNRQEVNRSAVSSLNLKLQAPKRLSEWREVRRRGMLYVEGNGEIMSTQYSLVIGKATSVWITVSPAPSQSTANVAPPLDMTLLVIRSKADKSGNSLITFTEKRDITGKYGVRCDLEAGKYYLLVATSGCSLPISKPSTEPQKKLVKKKGSGASDQYTLTKEFKYVLTDIFNMVDTDMNGLLSRKEFNQYSIRTGEDEIGDEEWEIVKENAELKNGELSCKGFMRLIELEAEDADGDTDDLWIGLEALGYDSSLTQNQAYPFTVEVYSEMDDAHTVNPLSGLLSSKSKSLQTALKEVYINKGELLPTECRCRAAKSSGNEKDVKIYMFETDTLTAIAIENKLPTRATVKLDCSSSKNVKSNTKSLNEVFAVPATTFMVAYYLVPADECKDWLVSCVEKDLLTAS